MNRLMNVPLHLHVFHYTNVQITYTIQPHKNGNICHILFLGYGQFATYHSQFKRNFAPQNTIPSTFLQNDGDALPTTNAG